MTCAADVAGVAAVTGVTAVAGVAAIAGLAGPKSVDFKDSDVPEVPGTQEVPKEPETVEVPKTAEDTKSISEDPVDLEVPEVSTDPQVSEASRFFRFFVAPKVLVVPDDFAIPRTPLEATVPLELNCCVDGVETDVDGVETGVDGAETDSTDGPDDDETVPLARLVDAPDESMHESREPGAAENPKEEAPTNEPTDRVPREPREPAEPRRLLPI